MLRNINERYTNDDEGQKTEDDRNSIFYFQLNTKVWIDRSLRVKNYGIFVASFSVCVCEWVDVEVDEPINLIIKTDYTHEKVSCACGILSFLHFLFSARLFSSSIFHSFFFLPFYVLNFFFPNFLDLQNFCSTTFFFHIK